MNVGGYSSFRVLLVLMLSMLCLPASAQTVVEYVHTDVLGSIVAISDTSGGLIGQRRVYEPYGSQIEPSMQDGPGYTGHVQDTGTGLVYMQQRYYDPGIGRFLSVDPVAAYDEPVKLFNRYRYGANNPYRFTDPDGRVDWDMFGDSFKIEGSLGMSLEAKLKLGPIKAALGLGSVSFGGGVTLAPDGYAFQEVAGPSATLEIGSYGFGARGGVERSYQGRHEKPWLEEKSGRVSAFQFKRGEVGIEEGGGNAEIAASVGIPMAKLSGSVDLGKAWKALTTPSGGGASAGNGGFQGVFRVTGRLESKRLGEALDGE